MALAIWKNTLLVKYYIIAGEPSGDLHGSNLMKAILEKNPSAKFRYFGGDHMKAVADGLDIHIKHTSIMGFVEVLKNLRKIKGFFKSAKKSILEFKPDRLILIDYPGFNLRMAEWAKKEGLHVSYYISPQLWAWKKGRIKKVKQFVDQMLVILPFEKQFYLDHNIDVSYVGHPLLPVIHRHKTDPDFRHHNRLSDKPILALLPGSRSQEISKLLPIYLEAVRPLSDQFQIVVAAAPNQSIASYQAYLTAEDQAVNFVSGKTYDLLSHASLAIVTSGTATLETALFRVPQVVCYQTSNLNYQIGKRLVDLKHICLVNLILDASLVPELIQGEVNPVQIRQQLLQIDQQRDQILDGYKKLWSDLWVTPGASTLAAELILEDHD